MRLSRYQKHELTILYEEATSRRNNSAGAWHVMLVEFIIKLGYDVKNYRQALNQAESLLFGGKSGR